MADPTDDASSAVSFVGEATLGANLHVISSPFDTSNVGGFFDQWRYIKGKDDRPPFYVDLFHLDLALQHPDETYRTRFEFWSPNQLNERGIFELDWRGLGLEVNHRRHRGELLRFFPSGTGEPGGYGSEYTPDVPNDDVFDVQRRFWITREGLDGELSLGFDEMGWVNPVLEKLTLYGDYQVRTGYRQDSLLAPSQLPGDFRGERREIDREVGTVGVALLAFPVEAFTANLDLELQYFSERAPQDLAFGFAVPNFVPDTNRITARLDASRRWASASLAVEAFVTHLEQTGTDSPLQEAAMIDRNVVTSYSLWSSVDVDLPSIFDVTGFVKWTVRENKIDPDFSLIQVSSPCQRSTKRLKRNLELGARPVSGTRLALGFRSDWTDRSLRFKAGGVPPAASAVRPDSSHRVVYRAGRTRPLRGLHLRGEIGYDRGLDTGYPNEFKEAVYFEGRSSYTLPVRLPVTLSASGRVMDGKSPRYEFAGSATTKAKLYQRLLWNYDVTATIVPLARLSIFSTFAQREDDQGFRHLRVTDPRILPAADYYIDSDADYRASSKSLSAGGRFELLEQVDLSAAASLTWTRVDYSGDAPLELALNAANTVNTRIIALEGDIDYEVVEGLEFGFGYRWQEYRDRDPQDVVDTLDGRRFDYSGTVHTLTLRARVEFGALSSLLP